MSVATGERPATQDRVRLRAWILCGLLLVNACQTSHSDAAEPRRPNVIFIMADDLGWSDLGCYGADLHETPHLDRLAREGVRFTQATAMSVCSPTRAAILTGKHAARLGMTIWREGSFRTAVPRPQQKLLEADAVHDLPHTERTIAELLQEAGYRTLHVGKWHLGDGDSYPESHGFEVNVGGTHWGAPDSFFWPFRGSKSYREFRYVPGLGLGEEGDYLTDCLTDEAIRLIDSCQDQPFFLNLWFYNPHTPIQAKPDLARHYQQKLQPGMHHQNPDYAAMVHVLDENVGRILKHLESRKLADRTLVIFTSDNGGYINEHKGRVVTSNAPLRSGKGSLYEGGIRVPLLVRVPGTAAAGSTCDVPVTCMDYYPTIAHWCGVEAPAEGDGRSLLELGKQPDQPTPPRDLFFHYPHYYATTTPVSAIRAPPYKLLEYLEDGRVELYNLAEDPGERRDLAAAMPERAAELRERLQQWRLTVGARLPRQPDSAPR